MEITPNALAHPHAVVPTQQAVTQSLPQLQAQAVMPIIARAVDTAPKAQEKPRTRSNGDRAKGGETGANERHIGSRVDIRV